MNVYDSIRMKDVLDPFGYKPTDVMEEADVVILNTCHIREKATEKMYSELGRVRQISDKRKKIYSKDTIIVVAGCSAQAEGDEIFTRAPYVDIVVGPQSYDTLPKLIAKIVRNEKHLVELDFVFEEKFDKLPQQISNQGSSAFVSVQEGCDKFCTYCVVPYTRGSEFSRPLEQVYREVMQSIENGAIEITLLGQNVNAYHGRDYKGNDCSLADLIKYIAKIPALQRIRYITSHPIDMKDDLIELHGTETKLMPFLHLPIQSGSDKILKMMNRKHNKGIYLDIIERLRKVRSDIVLSSDFIVGFPGETDKDFIDTLNVVKQVGYGQCYSFKYSPRPGTPAAAKEQLPESVKSERLSILQAELSKQQLEFNVSCTGKIMPVLFDRKGKFDQQIIGKTPYMQSVHLDDKDNSIYGKIVNINITQSFPTSLTGHIIQN